MSHRKQLIECLRSHEAKLDELCKMLDEEEIPYTREPGVVRYGATIFLSKPIFLTKFTGAIWKDEEGMP